MLKKDGLLVTANARIAPIATTVSPVPVLIRRFYPPQRYSCHSAGRLLPRRSDELTPRAQSPGHDGARGISSPRFGHLNFCSQRATTIELSSFEAKAG